MRRFFDSCLHGFDQGKRRTAKPCLFSGSRLRLTGFRSERTWPHGGTAARRLPTGGRTRADPRQGSENSRSSGVSRRPVQMFQPMPCTCMGTVVGAWRGCVDMMEITPKGYGCAGCMRVCRYGSCCAAPGYSRSSWRSARRWPGSSRADTCASRTRWSKCCVSA